MHMCITQEQHTIASPISLWDIAHLGSSHDSADLDRGVDIGGDSV